MIKLKTHPAPTIPDYVQVALDILSPRVFIKWNSRAYETSPGVFDGRWEIWCELMDVNHPDAKHHRSEHDTWNSDAQCWMRYLQKYETREGDFAPLDGRLLVGLEMADTWKNRRFYEEHIEEPFDQAEVDEQNARKEIYLEGAKYYKDLDRTLIGGSGGGGDWRWRIR